jgi:hypothetical protein
MATKPTHIVYCVTGEEEGSAKKGYWHDIGAAWSIKNGKGFKIKLAAFPLNGELVMLPNEPKEKPAKE